jgi:thiosulfate/3-mercaptopyruvate sulfurtransferase
MTASYLHPESIVSTAWLAEHLDDPRVRVFECTTYLLYRPEGDDLPYDVGSGRPDFDAGHIPGAGFLDLQNDLSDQSSPAHLRFTMLEPEALAAAFARLGVGEGYRVVLYSRDKPQWATRVWWMLRSIGFDSAAILDGGYEKWLHEGRSVSEDAPALTPATLEARPRPGLFVGRDAVLSAMSVDGCIINALSPELHSGESARYGRPGRIPGSSNVPALDLLDPDTNAFVSAEQAARAFEAVGANSEEPTLVYCGGGIAATLDAFLLYQLGHEKLAVYDASMSEWAKDDTLPMETG